MTRPTGNVLDQGFASLSKAGNGDRSADQREQLCAAAPCPGDV